VSLTTKDSFGIFLIKIRSNLSLSLFYIKALLRESANAQKSGDNDNESFIIQSDHRLIFEDPNALLTAASIEMIIAFITCLGPKSKLLLF